MTDIFKNQDGAYGKFAMAKLVACRYQLRCGVLTAGAYGCAQARLRLVLFVECRCRIEVLRASFEAFTDVTVISPQPFVCACPRWHTMALIIHLNCHLLPQGRNRCIIWGARFGEQLPPFPEPSHNVHRYQRPLIK